MLLRWRPPDGLLIESSWRKKKVEPKCHERFLSDTDYGDALDRDENLYRSHLGSARYHVFGQDRKMRATGHLDRQHLQDYSERQDKSHGFWV